MVSEEIVPQPCADAKSPADFPETGKEVQGIISNVVDKEKHDVDLLFHGNVDSSGCEENIGKGVKRPRTASEESSVRIVFSSLPRNSKRKLEELLLQWSEWHAQNCSSAKDLQEDLEHGEEYYFPAVNVGPDKSATVSFIMDNRVCKKRRIDEDQFGRDDTPLYEREYGIALTSEEQLENRLDSNLREAARCFNCGSYNHSLKDCFKPRDAAAVTNARKEFQSKKTPGSGPRGPQLITRYYQSSPAGKYDGLKPGVLSPETRTLLGLEELDPPPWLNRMRVLGYPPGYLDSEEEDEPSGIMIFGDEETDDTVRDNGKCATTINQEFISMSGDNDISEEPKSRKKMAVDFPGINAPVPENAGEKWVTPQNASNPNVSHKPFDNGYIAANMHHHDQWHLRGCVMPPSIQYGPGFSPLVLPHDINMPTLTPLHPREAASPRGIPIPRSPVYQNLVSNHLSPYHPGYSSIPSPGDLPTVPSWTLGGDHHSPYFHGDSAYHNPHSFSLHSYPYRYDNVLEYGNGSYSKMAQ
ncbi:Zinc finger CCHC domain-containing protein [Drosera capensis]